MTTITVEADNAILERFGAICATRSVEPAVMIGILITEYVVDRLDLLSAGPAGGGAGPGMRPAKEVRHLYEQIEDLRCKLPQCNLWVILAGASLHLRQALRSFGIPIPERKC